MASTAGTTSLNDQHLLSQQDYEAPLQGCQYPGVIPGSYAVALVPGYTVAEHVLKIGKNLESAIEFSTDLVEYIVYSAELDDELLKAVRADRGVASVECNRNGIELESLEED